MRMPRVRFTIGGLMIAVLVAGLICWRLSANRALRVQQARASYQNAKLVREVAEFALKEYEQGVYLQEKATYLGQLALAKSDQERAADRLDRSSKRRSTTLLYERSPYSEQLAKQQADFDLEQARMQLVVLEKYTMPKQVKALRADVAKAVADEQAKLATYQFEQAGRWSLPGF